MKICFLILAHQSTRILARLIETLLRSGSMVALHFDKKGGDEAKIRLRETLSDRFESLIWVKDRVSVVWGEWSMVQATLNALGEIRGNGEEPDYVYLLSGSDYPIRPIDDLRHFLERNRGTEYIESVDAERVRWVARGIQRERYLYRHPFNWRRFPRLFSWNLVAQRWLSLERKFPSGYQPYIGSQWWVLTWETCKRVIDLAEDTRLNRFFQKVWVPDEMFFQTVVRKITEESHLTSRHLTLYQFTGYGTPVVYSNGLESYLARQPFFFARKISPYADALRGALDRIVSGEVAAARFRDEEFGRVSEEYNLYCMLYRDGLFGRRVMGRVKNPALSELEWNRHPYFVVVAESRKQLNLVQASLNEGGDIRCHGELFHPERIEFLESVERYGGISKYDTAIRDSDPKSFFVDLLGVETGVLVGYLACRSPWPGIGPGRSSAILSDLLQAHARDPNAALIILQSDLKQTFRDCVEPRNMTYVTEKHGALSSLVPIAELYARFCECQLERDTLLAAAAKERGARILFVKVDNAWQDAERETRILEEIRRFLLTWLPFGCPGSATHSSDLGRQGHRTLDDRMDVVEASVRRRFHNSLIAKG